MFALTTVHLSGSILDCAAGPASFNAELTAGGHEVTSCDPLYRSTAVEILSRVQDAYDTMVANVRTAHHEFVWREFSSPEDLGEARMAAMETFLDDFPRGTAEGRYLDLSLPHLGFRDRAFDLVLCSHFLFTYSDRLSTEFHVASIEEMCRVATETRVFPLLKSYGGPSPHLEPAIDILRGRGYRVEIRRVPYEFQRGRDVMLVASGA
ncbi:MAG TPA: hypothetical protein VFY59_18420 [Rubrobacter sp.]|nr:hypothetical protein [Rubrobacter sp.]